MNVTASNTGDLVAAGQLNRVFGWALLIIGLVVAAMLDPWLFAGGTEAGDATSVKPMVRHAQGVVLGMAFLQLAIGHLLATPAFPRSTRRTVALLTAGGATLYATGYALGIHWSSFSWLVLVGSFMNLAGFVCLMCIRPTGDYALKIRVMLPIAAFGMLLDFTAGLFFVCPNLSLLNYLGPDDGLRLRMMRLARVAVIALSVITLLYQGLAYRASSERRVADRGGKSLLCGAIGMPLILAAACFTSTQLKYLLVLPASAVSVGVLVGLWLALRYASLLEELGWILIAISIAVGMIMGLYAFDGPLPTPEFFGSYNDIARRLARLAHSYAIVLGMVSIFLSREMERTARKPAPWGARLFIAGILLTLGMLIAYMIAPLPLATLYAGPTVTVVGLSLCLSHCWMGRADVVSSM